MLWEGRSGRPCSVTLLLLSSCGQEAKNSTTSLLLNVEQDAGPVRRVQSSRMGKGSDRSRQDRSVQVSQDRRDGTTGTSELDQRLEPKEEKRKVGGSNWIHKNRSGIKSILPEKKKEIGGTWLHNQQEKCTMGQPAKKPKAEDQKKVGILGKQEG
jgi:hypothetical protein